MTNFVAKAQAVIALERKRQIEVEGWTAEHDDSHDQGELTKAGSCYVDAASFQAPLDRAPKDWPFDEEWWKPKTIELDLIRAGAFFQADFDRLERSVEQDPVDHERPGRRAERLERVIYWRALATKKLAMLYRDRAELAKPCADYHGDLPDFDHPLRPVYESGIQYAVELLAKVLGVEGYEICDGTEEFDGDLGGTLLNIVVKTWPTDEHGDWIDLRNPENRAVAAAQ